MPRNRQKTGEADFKVGVYQEYFGTKKYIYRQEIDRIDFIITDKYDNHFLWAETKKNTADVVEMFVQLILTIGKARTFDKYNPPPFLAVFDYEKIAFLQYNSVHDLFYQNDFNWNVAPSDKKTKEFDLIKNIVDSTINDKKMLFFFEKDKNIIIEFIKNNLSSKLDLMPELITRLKIDKNNFVPTYYRWSEKVKPSIPVNWDIAKKNGIIDADFYLADLLSDNNRTLKESLFVLLFMNYYELDRKINDMGLFNSTKVEFNDEGKSHREFWEVYERPPKEEAWDYIVERRDLLVPQDVRERKGSFFTPRIWVEKSQEYLAKAFGENWQDEYYIWDCAAGTGNLLAGLTNKYNIWASTLDKADVDVMHDRIKNGANLLKDHVFQFDFLNDDFSKLPENLQGVINDEEKRKKLIVYINPPYAENGAGVGKGASKAGVSSENKTYTLYTSKLGRASRELFTQFFIRIYKEIPNCKITAFSKLKYINAPNFVKFRDIFRSEYLKGFVCRANTFDNVEGNFPISFLLWNLENKKQINKINCDVLDNNGKKEGQKKYYSYQGKKYINDWISKFSSKNETIGTLFFNSNDFQHQKFTYFSLSKDAKSITSFPISANNIFYSCIYFTIRLLIEPTWLNDRDQFLFPNDKYETDTEFQNDCLAFSLFHGQNRISARNGTNHWIPFTETDVNARRKYKSSFMIDFINGNIKPEKIDNELFNETDEKSKIESPIVFSEKAQNVLNAAKKLWQYYHKQMNSNADASYYDIREHFQGRNESGKMNNKSNNDTYNELIADLRKELKILAEKIQPKVYEYGFLLE